MRFSIPPSRKIQPFLDFGPMGSIFLNLTNYSNKFDNFEIFNTHGQIGFSAGIGANIGIRKQAILIQARYEYLVGQHTVLKWNDMYSTVNIYSSAINLLIAFRF